MSDPMTNTEVEDVLSSIRRLVSDDKRIEVEPKTPAVADRLVLTPSLRVMDDDASLDDANDADDDVTAQEDATQHGTDNEDATSADEEGDDRSADPLILEASEEAETAETDDADHETWDSDEPEQDWSETQDDEEASEDDASHADDDLEDAVDAEVDDAAPETLSEKIAALETLIADRSDEWEPDDAGTDAYAGTEPPAMAWEDAHDDDDVAEDEPAPQVAYAPRIDIPASEPERETDIFASDEDVLDEEALRELVSDIVREELQGALGERITRNVRKLVRREIHRALAVQDLE